MNSIIVAGAMTLLEAITPASIMTYTATPVQAFEEVQFVETIENKIDRIATEKGIATTSLYNLVDCESDFDPKADNGFDRGLVQINRKAWPEITDAQAFDPDFSLNWAAEKIAKGEGYIWVCGNCYAFAKVKLGQLPKMAEISGNTLYPRVGGLVIIYYGKLKHVAVIQEVLEGGVKVIEANYEPYLITKRLLTWEYLERYGATYWHSEL